MSQIPTQPSWNYQHPGVPSRSASAVGQYPAMTAPSAYTGSSIAPSSYPSSMPYARLQPVGHQTPSPYHSNSRSSYPTNHAWLPEDLTETYSLSSPNYAMSAQDSQLPSLNYTSPEMSRAWVPLPASRQPNQGFHMDQEGSSKYASPSYSLPSATLPTRTTGAPEGRSHFPAMNAMKTSLPTYSLPGSRILPAPDSNRGSTNNKNQASAPVLIAEDASTGLSQSLSYRSAVSWNSGHTGTEAHQHSTGSSTSSTVSGTDGVSSNSSSSPQITQKPTFFDYRPAQQDRASDYDSAYSLSSTASLRRHAGLDSSVFPGELSSDSILPSQDSSSNQYTYTLGNSSDNQKGTLVNGQSYTRLQEPQHAQSLEALDHLTSQAATYTNHRTSISNAKSH